MTQTLDIAAGAPPTLDHVVGQKRAVQQLRIALDAHINDRAAATGGPAPAFPHVLLVGPPGVGKSMLSAILARELGGKLHEELAQNITAPSVLHGLLMLPDEGDCLFLDEIHELAPLAQTTLYRALEDRRLFLPSASGERQAINLPPFTFLGATTDEWALTQPLRDRMKIILRLEHYAAQDLAQLLGQRVRRLGWQVAEEVITALAARGRGTPRLALRLLEATRRVSRAEGSDNVTIEHFKRMVEIEGVDPLGLDPLEQRYLGLLRASQEPVRLNVLAVRLGVARRTIEMVIEPDLLRLGLVTKDDEGRMLTVEGREHVSRPS